MELCSAGNGGQSASGAVKGEGGQSALEFGGGVVGFFVSGGRGPVSFRGCEGGRGASQLWSLVVVSSVFLFRGDGGQSASGAVKGGWRRVSFGEWRPVSFRGCEGGRGASQLWSLVVVSSVFLFRGDGGQSASGAVKGKGGQSALEFGVKLFAVVAVVAVVVVAVVVVCFCFGRAGVPNV